VPRELLDKFKKLSYKLRVSSYEFSSLYADILSAISSAG
jgi:hypothetical protein